MINFKIIKLKKYNKISKKYISYFITYYIPNYYKWYNIFKKINNYILVSHAALNFKYLKKGFIMLNIQVILFIILRQWVICCKFYKRKI